MSAAVINKVEELISCANLFSKSPHATLVAGLLLNRLLFSFLPSSGKYAINFRSVYI